MNKRLKTLDLFSGIGMIAYGLHMTNKFETVAFCELDRSCRRVLSKNFPGVTCYSNISDLHYKNGYLYSVVDGFTSLTSVDVICGGFPCQDISVANRNGEGLDGSRSGLWSEYKRLIGEINPKGVLIKNVSNLRNKGLGVILKDLHSLGYDAEWHCITAKYFGAYHERDRIFILAYRSGLRAPGQIKVFSPEAVGQGWESCKETLQQIYDNPFKGSYSVPKPLLRGVDVQNTAWVDRIKQVGNTVYWPIIESLGNHLHEQIT